MSVNYDEVAELLARQVLGGVDGDKVDYARRAMDLSLDKLQQKANLISQEKSGSFTSTGANDYTWSGAVIGLTDFFRAVRVYTSYGTLQMPTHQYFVDRYPDYRSALGGLPQFAVQWGGDNLLIYPDQAATTIYYSYYALLDKTKTDRVLSVLYDVARHFLENDPQSRSMNFQIAQAVMEDADRANDHSIGTVVRAQPEERVTSLNFWKRKRRSGR